MADVLIAGVTYRDVPAVSLMGVGGDPVLFSEGGGSAGEWFTGQNAELVATYSEEWGLADTSFVIGESVATSQTNIKGTIANRFASPTLNMADKDVIVLQRCLVTPTHSESAENKAKQIRYAVMYLNAFAKRKTTDAGVPSARSGFGISFYMNKYHSSSGSLSRTQSNYGFYTSPVSPTLASTTSASTTVRCSSPPLYYRVNSSYESATNIKLVTECIYKWNVEVYLCDPQTTLMARFGEQVDDILLNGI